MELSHARRSEADSWELSDGVEMGIAFWTGGLNKRQPDMPSALFDLTRLCDVVPLGVILSRPKVVSKVLFAAANLP